MGLYEALVAYFRRDNWDFNVIPHYQAVEMGVAGEHSQYRLVALADEERSIVRFLVFLEGKIPEPRRRDVMEFLTRANYGLLLGNFEMDLSDGEVRFRCSASTEGSEFSYEQYRNMLYISVGIMDRYYPGLQRVVQGSADPAAAISDIET
ncbi:MAG: YbjN domain-containing protein [Thermoanaerobaculum sp.]|nr:YbjN domain-containing protein [Thermoanaerobaculum sp.]MCX7895418.1 YbjN domain-containing protein [Thermoanaerobaculum sp.]MDW7967749.1 YbjN domain-containing protein [Thermoanaerobaculum sp.]